jgi:hypothetical protein
VQMLTDESEELRLKHNEEAEKSLQVCQHE